MTFSETWRGKNPNPITLSPAHSSPLLTLPFSLQSLFLSILISLWWRRTQGLESLHQPMGCWGWNMHDVTSSEPSQKWISRASSKSSCQGFKFKLCHGLNAFGVIHLSQLCMHRDSWWTQQANPIYPSELQGMCCSCRAEGRGLLHKSPGDNCHFGGGQGKLPSADVMQNWICVWLKGLLNYISVIREVDWRLSGFLQTLPGVGCDHRMGQWGQHLGCPLAWLLCPCCSDWGQPCHQLDSITCVFTGASQPQKSSMTFPEAQGQRALGWDWDLSLCVCLEINPFIYQTQRREEKVQPRGALC